MIINQYKNKIKNKSYCSLSTFVNFNHLSSLTTLTNGIKIKIPSLFSSFFFFFFFFLVPQEICKALDLLDFFFWQEISLTSGRDFLLLLKNYRDLRFLMSKSICYVSWSKANKKTWGKKKNNKKVSSSLSLGFPESPILQNQRPQFANSLLWGIS